MTGCIIYAGSAQNPAAQCHHRNTALTEADRVSYICIRAYVDHFRSLRSISLLSQLLQCRYVVHLEI